MHEEERRQMITRERERWSEEERNILTERYTRLVPSILLSLREDLFGLDRIQGGVHLDRLFPNTIYNNFLPVL